MTTVDPAFLEAGQSPGLEIWRIEKLKVIRQGAETLGDFYSGDSYIILQTSKSGRSDKLEWDIHFWLGKTTSQDEAGVAAYKTVELDDWLGGGPVQYREVQEHESRKFLAYFKNGIRYLDGGVESGFKKVQRDVYDKRLFQIKGKRNVRIKQVELTYKSLNQGDVFILDDGLMIYVWNGPRSSKTERIKGLEIARRIKDEERGGKAKLHIIDDRFDRDLKFFKALGDKGEISSAEEGGDDVAFEQSARQELRLFRVTDASGSLEMEEIAERPFRQEHLDSNDCFILDSGTSGIWVWVGKNCTTNEKKSAMSNAIEFLSVRGYPKYTRVTRVAEKGEPPLFKQFFPVWRAPEDQIGMGQVRSTSSIAQYSDEKFDTSVLHTQTQKRQQGVIPDDGSGHVQLWRVENNDLTPLSQETHGLFYSGDCYVILYTFGTGGREKFIIYFWQGSRSSVDERGASAILAERMDKQMGGVAVQVRVVQNQEPEHFLRIFSGRMVTLMGGINNEVEETSIKMYHVRGTNEVNTRAAQVPASASSLNSNDVFMVVTDYDTFLWIGKGSSQEEARTASGMTRVLSPNARPVVVQEGDEPSDFWEALGGRAEYVTAKRLENTRAYVPPRLFQASNASGRFHVEEIVDFSQEDLCEDDVFLLDVFDEIYVWIGKGANEIEKKESLHTAKEYVLTDPSGRSLDDTVLLQVKQGYEPPSFTAYFLGWDPDMWKQMKSYEQLKEEVSEEGRGVTLVDEELSKYTRTYSLEELRRRLPPDGVDVTCKEKFLSDTEFEKVFHITREKYDSLPRWKQIDLKKKMGLF